MPDWIGISTKLFGAIGQRLLKRWLFRVEFLTAYRSVYVYEHGGAPFVDLSILVLVHNRNSAPTTIYARGPSVKLKTGTDKNFERVTVFPGGGISLNHVDERDRYDMGGSSSIELLFHTRGYNPRDVNGYCENAPLTITLELVETFGNHIKLTGPLSLRSVTRQ